MAIQFEEHQQSGRASRKARVRGLTGYLIRKGFAKNKRQANMAQLVILVVLFVIMLLSFSSTTGPDEVDERYIFNPATAEPDPANNTP